jgi:hypothetical protein
MKPIKILYWTPLTFDGTKFTPVFFFKPNLELLTYIEQNGYFNIPITISGTNKLYDGFTYVLMDIATMPGGCPNDFQDSPVIYSCTMNDTAWTVYPYEPFIGEFTICSPLTTAEFKKPEQSGQQEEIKENFCGCFANKKKKEDLEEDFAPPLETKSKVPQDDEPISNIVTFQEPPKEPVPKPKKYVAPNNTVIIICLFLAIIIVLILCFYGDLRNF